MRQSGFSLLEFMIALLVLTLVLGGVVHAVGAYAANQQRLRDATLAQWVAMNRLAEARLGLLATDTEHADGTDRMGGQSWQWKVRRDSLAKAERLVRLSVEVHPDQPADRSDARPLYRADGLRFLPSDKKDE